MAGDWVFETTLYHTPRQTADDRGSAVHAGRRVVSYTERAHAPSRAPAARAPAIKSRNVLTTLRPDAYGINRVRMPIFIFRL